MAEQQQHCREIVLGASAGTMTKGRATLQACLRRIRPSHRRPLITNAGTSAFTPPAWR